MGIKITCLLVIILFSLMNCHSIKNTEQKIVSKSKKIINVLNATENNYFPGAGLGRGKRYHITLVNQGKEIVFFDSIQTNLHCLPFDGHKLSVSTTDTISLFAYGLTIDTDLFPNIQAQVFKGDTSLRQGAKVFYHTALGSETISFKQFQTGTDQFFE
jgi:hypothetical protein